MLEYRLDNSAYLALKIGNGLIASGQANHGLIEDVYAGIYKTDTSFNIITHIMTRWKGSMDDQRRKSVFVPFSLNSLSLPCSSARFSQGGIDYIFNTMETQVGEGDDFIHKSDIICTTLQGSFPANSAGDFQKRLQKYIQLSNTLYSRFYQGKEEAPRVLLDFSHVLAYDLYFECVKNNHLKTPIHGRAEELTSIIIPENKVDFSQVSRGFRRIRWADIGGLFEPKKKMRDYLDDFYNPEVSKSLGLDPSERGGIFFFGETGNGKTLIAEAVATELSDKSGSGFIPFFVDYSNLSTKWRGEEAKATANLFRSVRKEVADGKKVMLFLDEFQQTGQRDDTQKCANEVLDQMLVETSRFDYRNCILMAATAQDPSTIEPQLLRPGRFGEKIFFENPTTEEAVDILKKQVELRASASSYKNFVVKEGIDYMGLAEKGEDFTLADWYDLVQDVLKIKAEAIRAGERFRPIRTEDFLEPVKRRMASKSRTRSRESII